MKTSRLLRTVVVPALCLTIVFAAPPTADAQPGKKNEGDAYRPHAGMMLYPDVSATHIVFVYANDLWVVPRDGGDARPLAAPPGREGFPRFSADGKTIAFMGNYDGNLDIYTIPSLGGRPKRVTHHPASERLCDWTPDGRLLFYSNGLSSMRRLSNIYTVSPNGGLPKPLPVPYGTVASISADGNWLAYTPNTRDTRTWKRYRGGMATDIWLFHLKTHEWKTITNWEGTDTQPMWHGKTVYYLSDNGKQHRLNIWAFDTTSGKHQQITHFSDYDVKWPSIGPGPNGKGEIVFQAGSKLRLLDLASGKSKVVKVTIPGDRPTLRPKSVDVSKFVQELDISSTGKRLVVQARGDIWTVAAGSGPPRNLTNTDGVYERSPEWSPDGRWIAYFSDKTGEYELYVTQSDGRGSTRQLTKNGKTFRYRPTWSPDSKHIVFSDKTGALSITNVKTGATKHVDTDSFSRPMRVSWSHDSSWIAYAKSGQTRITSVWLYDVNSGKKHQVTAGMFADSWPTFDRKGEYLYFASNRKFTTPIYEDIGTTFVYANTDILLAVPLRNDVRMPGAPKIDDETWKGKKKTKSQKPVVAKPPKKSKSLPIDLDGFERRAVILPTKAGSYSRLAVSATGKLFYVRGGARGTSTVPAIYQFDIKSKSETTVLAGVGGFSMSADGKKLLVRRGTSNYVIAAAPGQKPSRAVSMSGLSTQIDPRKEWKQILTETWRIQRDFFYDPYMHGVDWPAVRNQYAAMIADCATREDVSYVIGEMIAELNVGHAYVRGGGDTKSAPTVSVGLLGCDYELSHGAYRILKIYEGAAWDADARGPLSQPGVNVKAGDYLLAVNGTPVDTSKDPWAAFIGLAGKVTSITVSKKPKLDDSAREIVLKPLSSEGKLRYRAWVEKNRAYVAKKTKNRVGYIHVPDTGVNGQNELVRQFHGQRHLPALIIDERWNGGGQIPTRFIELLNRPVTNYWAVRNGRDWTWPPDSHQGPKCMLINGLSGSGGDAFPAYFRQAKLGKLIGRRTWGGLVGISGNPSLIDGGTISSPTFAYYETDGTWGIEGHGVDPDIDVIDDPSKMVNGGDPQLDVAIEHMLKELKARPYTPPRRPKYPKRLGIGIHPKDKYEFNAVGIVEKSTTSKQNQNAESETDSNETATNKYSPTAPKNAKNSEVPDAPPVNIEQPNMGRSVIGPGLKSTAVAPRGDPGNVRPSRIGPPPSASAGSRGNGNGSFFDIEIEGGKRIVYLLDRSPSMHDQPLRLAKQKLIASLNGLNLEQRFQVIFFNNRLLPVTIATGSSDPLAPGSKSNVLTAKLKIESVKEAGSTNHKLALRAALEKSRSPDVVFFLTDSHGLTGRDRTLASADLQEILRLNKSRARIHCIEFGEGADLSRGDNFLKQLAASTRGRYITLRSDGGGRINIRCYIIDYTGKEITFRTSLASQKKSRPSNIVIAVKTPQSKSHVVGLVHFSRKRYDEAQISFEKALPLEDREWVRRELLAMLIRCALMRGDFQSACTRYVLLIQSDPATRHQHLLPLVWGPRDLKNDLKAKSRSWVNDSRPIVQLIGASILLSDARTVELAKRTLIRLTRSTPQSTRDLARMQLWRDRLRRGSINGLELADWQSQVDALDESIRGGPYYLLGVAHRNRRESEQAAAAFLWLPLVYDHDHHLAAPSLIVFAAGIIWFAGGKTAFAGSSPAFAAGDVDFRQILDDAGVIGYLILFLSIAMVALIVEHMLSFRRGVMMPSGLAEQIHQMLQQGQIKQARQTCQERSSFLSHVLAAGLGEVNYGYSSVEKALEDASTEQSARMFRKIEYLSVIGTIAPMLGLLGTVWGLMLAFQEFELKTNPHISELAPGIRKAMVTTLMGLTVAVPALAAFAIFRNRIDELVAETSLVAEHVVGEIKRPLTQHEKRAAAKTTASPAAAKTAAAKSEPSA
eukprot:g21443.t1